MSGRIDVAVVGAGPVGLFLALGLARSGRRVLVLEKEPHTAEHSRAPAIWPRTQEVLASLGVLDRFLARGLRLGRVRLADADRGGVLLSLPLEELAGETAFPWLLIVPQSVTERLHRRLSSRFVAGRVALAGDAAHLNSPVGGQGMNAGLQDASALTKALLRALEEGVADPLAYAYGERRRRAIEGGVNPFTDRLTRLLLFRQGRMIRSMLRAADLLLRVGPARRRFLRRIAMLD